MATLAALFTLIARLEAQQEALIEALKKKGAISADEIETRMPDAGQLQEKIRSLSTQYEELRRLFASGDK